MFKRILQAIEDFFDVLQSDFEDAKDGLRKDRRSRYAKKYPNRYK